MHATTILLYRMTGLSPIGQADAPIGRNLPFVDHHSTVPSLTPMRPYIQDLNFDRNGEQMNLSYGRGRLGSMERATYGFH